MKEAYENGDVFRRLYGPIAKPTARSPSTATRHTRVLPSPSTHWSRRRGRPGSSRSRGPSSRPRRTSRRPPTTTSTWPTEWHPTRARRRSSTRGSRTPRRRRCRTTMTGRRRPCRNRTHRSAKPTSLGTRSSRNCSPQAVPPDRGSARARQPLCQGPASAEGEESAAHLRAPLLAVAPHVGLTDGRGTHPAGHPLGPSVALYGHCSIGDHQRRGGISLA